MTDTCFCRLNQSSLQHRRDKGFLGKRTDHIQGLIKGCCHHRAFQIHLILHRQTPARHAGTVPWPHLTDPRQWPHPEVLTHTARQQAAISTDHNVCQREKRNNETDHLKNKSLWKKSQCMQLAKLFTLFFFQLVKIQTNVHWIWQATCWNDTNQFRSCLPPSAWSMCCVWCPKLTPCHCLWRHKEYCHQKSPEKWTPQHRCSVEKRKKM